MKKQNLFGEMVKKAFVDIFNGEASVFPVSDGGEGTVFYCYQPKEPKGLDKFNK